MRKNLHQSLFVQHGAVLSLGAALLLGSAQMAQAQPLTGYNELPPPPLGISSPYGNTAPRGEYVLPGTRKHSGTTVNRSVSAPPRAQVKLPPLPRRNFAEMPPAPLALTSPLPSTRLLRDIPVSDSLNPRNHRASTSSTLRYATPRTERAAPSYPTPTPAAAAPAPVLVPQAPVATVEDMPFGKPSKPLGEETSVIVTAPPALQPVPAEPRILPVPQAPVATAEATAAIAPAPEPAALEPLPWETPAPTMAEPVMADSGVVETAPLTADMQEEFNAIIAPPAAPDTEEPQILTLAAKPEMPAGDINTMPLEPEVALMETPEVTVAPIPALSEESRSIISKTPSGIGSREVLARTPEPVIIKRDDPEAGTIPTVDVRTHEEMGLKIEVRRADVNVHEYLEQGYDNLLAGREAIAAGYYNEALNAAPRNELALFGLATTYQRMGRNDEARELYGKLLAQNPTHREALNNFMALISHEAPQEAIVELEKLESENPDFSPIPAQLGVVYNQLGMRDMAVKKLARALQLEPANISYKYNLAVTLDSMGHAKEAAELYMELIEDYNHGATLPGDIVDIRNRAIFLNNS